MHEHDHDHEHEQGLAEALMALTGDAVVVLDGEQVLTWNAAAERLFGVTAASATASGARPFGDDVSQLTALATDGDQVVLTVGGRPVLAAAAPCPGGTAVVLRDHSASTRWSHGQRVLAELSRTLLGGEAVLRPVLQRICSEARVLTGAEYSALVVLREGSSTEIAEFIYDAPRELFPARMPRAVGLLAVPMATRRPARLDDIRGHPAGVGLPGVHPPMGPLLAVPMVAGESVLGEIAVSGPPGSRVFDEVDQGLMVELASHAAVALRWAQAADADRERRQVRQAVVDTARHDIRTPVGAGKGYALLLARKLDRMSPDQVATALSGLVDSFERIERFSDRLLVDEKADVSGVEPRWQVVELAPLLQALVRDLAVSTGADGGVVLDHEPDGPTTVAADPEMLREVLDNLVGNALKYAGHATVTVRSEGSLVRFDVRDDGPGIPVPEQARLFDRWTRGEGARRGKVAGDGLGLSIVKRLVTAHGGSVGVSSRPGDGATFWVTFPAQVPS